MEDFPQAQESLEDEKIEGSFDLLKEVTSISSAARMKGMLKRRWPLNEAIICVEKGQKEKLESLSDLLVAQLNVEKFNVIEIENKEGYKLVLELKSLGVPAEGRVVPITSKIGPKAKQHMNSLLPILNETHPDKIIQNLHEKGEVVFEIDDSKIVLVEDDFTIFPGAKKGYAIALRDGIIVFISIERDQEMRAKGLVKDLARRLQTLRKKRGYKPTDILNVASILDLDDDSLGMLKEREKELAFLVRVKQVSFTESCKEYNDDDIDGKKIRISVE